MELKPSGKNLPHTSDEREKARIERVICTPKYGNVVGLVNNVLTYIIIYLFTY